MAGSYAFEATEVGRRLALCSDLARMKRAMADGSPNPAAKPIAHAVLRQLIPEQVGAPTPADALYAPSSAARLISAAIEAAADARPAVKVRVATMAKSLRAMTLAAARAAGIGTAFEVPLAPREYVAEPEGAPVHLASHAFAQPIVDEALSIGRGTIAEAVQSVREAYHDYAAKRLLRANDVAPELMAEQARMRNEAERFRQNVVDPAWKEQEKGAPSANYERAVEQYDAMIDESFKLTEAAMARAEEIARMARDAMAKAVEPVLQAQVSASPVDEATAESWATANVVITKKAAARLRKMGYAPEQVVKDAAEFYRMAHGTVDKLVIDSDGRQRANATGVDAHGVAGTINLGARFDKRVLWHEMGHHIEADPVAAAAARLYIRLRSDDGGMTHTLRGLTGVRGYARDEIAFKDGFFSPYVGKVYPHGMTEVFSMVMESFSAPELLAQRLSEDPQTFEFVTGYLRSPKTSLDVLHQAMRESMLVATEQHASEVSSRREAAIARESAKVKLIQARELPNDAGEIVQRLVNSGGHRMVGYLRRDADGVYFCLTETKARNPETRRRSKCFGFVRCTPGANGVGMNWYFVPAKEPELARIALACYRDTDELPPYDALAAGQITVKESE